MTRKLIIVVIGAAVLTVLFLIFKPNNQVITQNINQATTQDTIQDSSPSATLEQNVKTFDVTIQDKKIASDNQTFTVNKDMEVIFKLTADRTGEFHLHGYDIDVKLEKGIPGEMKITANLTGRFEIEFHESETNKYEIGVLEVLPE